MVLKMALDVCMQAVLLLLICRTVESASMNVHALVGLRAIKYFGKISPSGTISQSNADFLNHVIQSNPESVAAGADFPDFMYACNSKFGDHHDEGEAAHWPPFHAVAVRYIQSLPNSTNIQEWDDDTKKLVAFVFGLSVHFVTDEVWEGLTPQLSPGWGFIESVDYLNGGGNGQGDVNENLGNMGGDFYTAWVLNESSIKPFDRVFPLDHLVKIYHQTPKNAQNKSAGNFSDIQLPALEECEVLFDLGLWALKNLGPFAFPEYNREMNILPIVEERVFEMPLSGVDDMATYVTFAWNRIASWLINGVPSSTVQNQNHLLPTKSSDNGQDGMLTYRLFRAMSPFVANAKFVQNLPNAQERIASAIQQKDSTGNAEDQILLQMLTAVKGVIKVKDKTGDLLEYSSKVSRLNLQQNQKPLKTYTGSSPLQYTGSSIETGDFDGDGKADLVIGQYGATIQDTIPRAGMVSIYYGNGTNYSIEMHEALGRFGWDLAVLDFNLDGVDDLIVGAPGASDWNISGFGPFPSSPSDGNWGPGTVFRFEGKVLIFFGSKTDGLQESDRITLTADENLIGLGTTVETGDINGDGHADLLLGCPLASDSRVHPGRMYAVPASKTWTTGSFNISNVASIRIDGLDEFGWFGQSLAVLGDILLVGAPFARNGNGTAVGKVYGFQFHGSVVSQKFHINGTSSFGEFGYTLRADETGSFVAIAVPDGTGSDNYQRGGVVYVLNNTIGASIASNQTDRTIDWHMLIQGDFAHGRLGYSIDILHNRIALGFPFYGRILNDKEIGSAFIYNITQTYSPMETWKQGGDHGRSRYGSAVKLLPDGTVAIGSPTGNIGSLEGVGFVDIYST